MLMMSDCAFDGGKRYERNDLTLVAGICAFVFGQQNFPNTQGASYNCEIVFDSHEFIEPRPLRRI